MRSFIEKAHSKNFLINFHIFLDFLDTVVSEGRELMKITCKALCSRNFQNVKLRLDFVTIIILLRFYVKSNFGEFKQSKNVNFGNFRGSEH